MKNLVRFKMNNKIDISIIIPCFNQGSYIDEAIGMLKIALLINLKLLLLKMDRLIVLPILD